MDEEVKQARASMEGRMSAMEGRILERIHDSETRLLSAFYGWGKPIESRLRLLPTLNERLGFLEERITALERKNLPGQQARARRDLPGNSHRRPFGSWQFP